MLVCRLNKFLKIGFSRAWGNSSHFATPPLVSRERRVMNKRRNYILMMFHSPVVPLIGTRVTKEICFNPSEALARSGWWRFISIDFLRSFPRHHFAGKPVVLLRNVSCFLRLVLLLPNNCQSFHLSIIVSNFFTALKALNIVCLAIWALLLLTCSLTVSCYHLGSVVRVAIMRGTPSVYLCFYSE